MKQTSDNFQKILKWSVDRTVIFSRQNMFPKTDQITIWQVGPRNCSLHSVNKRKYLRHVACR